MRSHQPWHIAYKPKPAYTRTCADARVQHRRLDARVGADLRGERNAARVSVLLVVFRALGAALAACIRSCNPPPCLRQAPGPSPPWRRAPSHQQDGVRGVDAGDGGVEQVVGAHVGVKVGEAALRLGAGGQGDSAGWPVSRRGWQRRVAAGHSMHQLASHKSAVCCGCPAEHATACLPVGPPPYPGICPRRLTRRSPEPRRLNRSFSATMDSGARCGRGGKRVGRYLAHRLQAGCRLGWTAGPSCCLQQPLNYPRLPAHHPSKKTYPSSWPPLSSPQRASPASASFPAMARISPPFTPAAAFWMAANASGQVACCRPCRRGGGQAGRPSRAAAEVSTLPPAQLQPCEVQGQCLSPMPLPAHAWLACPLHSCTSPAPCRP